MARVNLNSVRGLLACSHDAHRAAQLRFSSELPGLLQRAACEARFEAAEPHHVDRGGGLATGSLTLGHPEGTQAELEEDTPHFFSTVKFMLAPKKLCFTMLYHVNICYIPYWDSNLSTQLP